jgi:soluble lytic murein transglycosylase
VEEAIGGAAALAGDYPTAAQAYRAAIAAPRAGPAFDQQERLAEVYAVLGEVESALVEYQAIYQQTNQNWRKARALVAAGQVLYNAGQAEAAYARFLEAVNNYPEARDSFQGLLILVNDGVPVDDLQRGLTNYYAENYEPAIAAFERRLDSIPEADLSGATALYHLGLSYAALEEDEQAIAAFRRLVEDHPADPLWAKAYFQIAFLQPYPADAQTFQDFAAAAAAAPAAPEAPDALYRAARLAERHDDFREAAALWLRIVDEYPESGQAADAAMQSGLVLYRAGELGAAGQRFERATTLGSDPGQHARAWLWIGKVKEALGDSAGAEAAWTRAAATDPHGYYSLRAEELLRGETPFTPPPAYDFAFDAEAEREQTEAWLRATFPLAQNMDAISELHPGIWQEARFVRGAELWRLGRLIEAHAEFDSLRLDLSGDPLAMWQLALYFDRIGAHDLAIRSARAVMDLAGYADTLIAPRLILLLRFPAPFLDYVLPASDEFGQHPFVLLSKIRLESFFWKHAFSSAEARGLSQIIPATADDVARKMGLADFAYDDLYRPALSIPMGAYYLAYVGSLTDDDPAASLAGYYAGPGNAQAWQALANGDPDLFVEVIRLPDAKLYVQTVYEYFAVYEQVYGRSR